MNLLITGNMGYIGPVLSKYLNSKDNINIHGFDIGWFENETLGSYSIDKPTSQTVRDIRDLSLKDLEGIDAVIHLAAVSNDPMGKEFATPTRQINLDASINLIKMCHKLRISKFIFASSCSVYGAGGILPKTENDEVMPITEYAVSKIKFENYLKEFSKDSDIQITCLRFATAAGPSPRIRLDLVLNDFVTSALTTDKISILSNGDPIRPIIDAEDMSRAFYWSLKRSGDNFEIFNTGLNENNMTVLELAESVQSIIPSAKILVNKEAAPDKRSYRVNFDKFSNSLPDDMKFKHNISSIIKRLVSQLEHHSNDLQNFRNSLFIRHNKLRELKKSGILDRQLRIVK